MNIITTSLDKDWQRIVKRPGLDAANLEETVSAVFDNVEKNGDEALRQYTQAFDQVAIDTILLSETEIKSGAAKVSQELQAAIRLAKSNIETFHKAQQQPVRKVVTMQGVTCWQESRAIEKIGIYIPGGSAPLFSTVLMLAVPAAIAGCKEIILCTPPDRQGNINTAILYAANLCGITRIARVGGIQAIAALSFGTQSIPAVYKIFGPGNQYVTAAKQMAMRYGIAIDLPAGPSELMVVADETAVPAFVAADLLSQAEHGADSQVLCLVNNEKSLAEIGEQVNLQVKELPRKNIAVAALKNAYLVLAKDKETTIQLVNDYAPEHLILCTAANDFYTKHLVNAGSVFIGNYAPESAGDYASGTNHTLPTHGHAKAYSGVSLDAFVKKITFQEITLAGLQNIGPAIELMAQEEQLQAHKNAVTIRLKSLK